MGGTKFVDFHLMRRYVGLSKYVSVEHDPGLHLRCAFNKPFEDIQIFDGKLSTYLSSASYNGNSVFWADLEVGLGDDLIEACNAIAEHCKLDDILFVTIRAELLAGMGKKSNSERRQVLKSQLPHFGSLIDKMRLDRFSDGQFRYTCELMLGEIVQSAFSIRSTEGKFHPYMRVVYKDSCFMATVGGAFLKNKSRRAKRIDRAARASLGPMCPAKAERAYMVPDFNFSDLEKIFLDRSNVAAGDSFSRCLLEIGIPRETLEEYKEIAKFVPRYVEPSF
ncbi:hypothetical protein KHP57_03315 [Algiphilus sp. NNCM1]|nr:hypothetical protein [Algiphilus acroporae]